jgi:drug/metabolite transporter (DMT)-like permease
MWLRRNGTRPTLRALMGVALGLVGVGALALHGGGAGGSGINPIALLLLFSSGIWAWGSLYAQRAELPSSPLMATAVEMLMGGAALLIMATVSGEPATLTQHTISLKSLEALGYLIVFGSIVAYTAYTWLLKNAPPALVSTYAYVNPLVAVLLGWFFLQEVVTVWTLISSAVIISSVVLITLPRRRNVAAAPALPQNEPQGANDGPVAALGGPRAR